MPGQSLLWPDVPPPGELSGDARDVARRREHRASSRDVHIPPVKDPARREACELDLRRFCLTYLKGMFPRPFSRDHRKIIATMQDIMLNGGRTALAGPRGSGKSTITVGSCLWALFYGYRQFLAIMCENHENSKARLESIRVMIETSDIFLEDFPGPCSCVRALEGAWNRANAQTVQGMRTHIHWGGEKILVFPTLEGEPSSGSAIATRSMGTAIRGLQHTRPDGTVIRPDLALLDDPIEPDEARSAYLVGKREKKILSDVLGLAGPGENIACIYLGTIIEEDDLTCRFLSHEKHPEWRGQKFKLMYSMPTNMALWERYDDLRAESLQKIGDITLATDFYREHRAEMDAGAEPAWPERFIPDVEISAIQHAMNHYLELGEDIFNSEYQNEPPKREDTAALVLTPEGVEATRSGLSRGFVPENSTALVAGWDVGRHFIHWVVMAFAPGRIGSFIDYGQEEVHGPLGRIDAEDTRTQKAMEMAIFSSLRSLRDKFADEPYCLKSGEVADLEFTLIDSSYLTHVIEGFCTEAGPRFGPVRGCGTGRNQPNYYVPRRTGVAVSQDGNMYWERERSGQWKYSAHVDAFKEQLHGGLLLPPSEPGSIALFAPEHRRTHRTFATHITAEQQLELVPGRLTWEKVPGRRNNHWLDASVYVLAAVSLLQMVREELGVGLPTKAGFKKRKRTRVTEVQL